MVIRRSKDSSTNSYIGRHPSIHVNSFTLYFQVRHLHSTVSSHQLTSAVIFEAGNKVVQRKR